MAKKIETAAERFHAHMVSRQVEEKIVDVPAPSGFVYRYRKPSKFKLLIGMGELPQTAADAAVGKWQADGLGKSIEAGEPDAIKIAEHAFRVLDQVIDLSYSPKLVNGRVPDASRDEIAADAIPDEDMEYLFKWIQAGGEQSLMLDTFPVEPQQRSLASSSRKKRRATA